MFNYMKLAEKIHDTLNIAIDETRLLYAGPQQS